MATDTFAGPVGCLVFAFPEGAPVEPGLLALLRRVESGHVEVLDLEVVARGADGLPVRLALADLSGPGGADLSEFEGAESDVLDADDLAEIAAALEPGWFAIAVVYEDRSLAGAADAWARAGGVELLSGGVDLADLERALTEGTVA